MSNRRICYPSQKAKENMETEAIILFWKVFTQTQNSKSTNDPERLRILLTKINAAYDLVDSNTKRIGNDIKLVYANLVGEIQKKIVLLQTTESKPEASVHHPDRGNIKSTAIAIKTKRNLQQNKLSHQDITSVHPLGYPDSCKGINSPSQLYGSLGHMSRMCDRYKKQLSDEVPRVRRDITSYLKECSSSIGSVKGLSKESTYLQNDRDQLKMLETTFQPLKLDAISQHSSSHRRKEVMPSLVASRNPGRHVVSKDEPYDNAAPKRDTDRHQRMPHVGVSQSVPDNEMRRHNRASSLLNQPHQNSDTHSHPYKPVDVDELRYRLEMLQQIDADKDFEKLRRLEECKRIEHEEELQRMQRLRESEMLQREIDSSGNGVYDNDHHMYEQKEERQRVQRMRDTQMPQEKMYGDNYSAYDTDHHMPPYQRNTQSAELVKLAEVLTDSMTMNRLPIPEPTIFRGDPLAYHPWKTSFDMLIGHGNVTAAEKIFFLQKYTSGEAKKCIEGAFYLESDEAYISARKKLERRFGSDFTIAEAFRNRLAEVKKINKNDYTGLQQYADLLSQTNMARESIFGLEFLDDRMENQRMAKKLPDAMIHRWAQRLLYFAEEGRYPLFSEFVLFVNNESEMCNHPLISNLFDRSTHNANSVIKNKCFATDGETKPEDSQNSKIKQDPNPERKDKSCEFCNGKSHNIEECTNLASKPSHDKVEYVTKNNLCFSCLRHGHHSKECKRRRTCATCKYRHPTSLHSIYEERYATKKETKTDKTLTERSERHGDDTSGSTLKTHSNDTLESYTMVLPVYVSSIDDPANKILVYALLDTQSNTTFILEDVANDLNVTKSHQSASLHLTTMTSTTVVKCKQYERLQIRGLDSSSTIPLPTSYSRNEIPGDMSQIATKDKVRHYPHLQCIQDKLHDLQDCKIGLLVGCNCSRAIAPINSINTATPFAWETELGWCIVGTNEATSLHTKAHTMKTIVRKEFQPQLDRPDVTNEVYYSSRSTSKDEFNRIAKILESDFIENKGDNKVMSQDDIEFLKIIDQSIHQNNDGLYQMKLLFREDYPTAMTNNKAAVLKRLEHLKNRLSKNPKYHADYTKFMNDILQNQDAEAVPREELKNSPCWYLPHHGVYHPKKPNKIRVVFDCSMVHKGLSLNKSLLQGPDMMNNLVGILCRFRKEPIAFIGDIERMYHRFHVYPSDRDFLRFLWFEEGNLNNEPTTYRMKVHLFGAVSSPACANFGLKRLAADYRSEDTMEAADFIRDNFYVDDGLFSCETVEEAVKILNDARAICKKGNLRLHKFISNNKVVLSSIPTSELAEKKVQDLSFEKDHDYVDRVLGIQWLTESDQFQFKLTTPQTDTATRRIILSTVASVYDPIGLIAPFTLKGKILLQDLCKLNSGWDEPITGEHLFRWMKWSSELSQLKSIKVDRCYKPHDFGTVAKCELHHFSDASNIGYGQCSYLRMIDVTGRIHCSLVMSKSRVAPKKILTIPRLELMAAVTSVKIGNILKTELQYEKLEEFYWTDSQIVLCYLNNSSKRFHVFVANRIQFILDHTQIKQWRYVSTHDNPADSASRGLSVQDLITNSSWWRGPELLWNSLPEPEHILQDSPLIDDPEVKKVMVYKTSVKSFSWIRRLERFSDWHRAIRGINVIRRFIRRKKHEPVQNDLMQLLDTEVFILKSCQAELMPQEIHKLLNNEQITDKTMKSLDPFLDVNTILRVGGRLRRAPFDYNEKHPMILPKYGHLTQLIIKHYHEKAQHQGRGITISTIRSNGFYIIGVSRLVASMIFKCVRCRKLRHATQVQKMSDLPSDRIEPSAPFTFVSLDCFGPYLVNERRKEIKRYGLLFVCQASRAIHLEVLDDMSTDCFLNSLRCFIALRGTVSMIRCDQGTNFIGAARELQKAYQEIDCEKIKNYFLNKGCEFVFNSPYSSHMGGTFERQIRTVRSILNNILHNNGYRIDTPSLRTFLYEVMSLVNSRPLSGTFIQDSELEPLTPNHLIMMKSTIITPPPGNFDATDLYARKRWRQVQQLTNMFWDRFRKEYLLNLQHRQKWTKTNRNITVGDIVLLKEDDVFRGNWRMGKVIKIIGSADHTRRVQLEMGNKQLTTHKTILERPIHKLVLLLETEQ